MGQAIRCLRRTTDGYSFWCPGCKELHWVRTDGPKKPCWGFDGNVESPTFTPSILITGKQIEQDAEGRWTGNWVLGPDGAALNHVCHTFVTAGRINFLGDCTHALAGQTIDLPDLPPWAADPTREEAPMSDPAKPADEINSADAVNGATGAAETGAGAQGGATGAENPETPPQPAAAAQDGKAGEPDQAQNADQAEKGSKETLTLALDAKAMADLTEALGAQIREGMAEVQNQIEDRIATLRDELKQEMNEFAGHFEGKLDKLDVERLEDLVGRAQTAMEQIAASGVGALDARLTKLEMSLRHSL